MAVERKYERDVDLLLAEEVAVNPVFADGLKAMTRFVDKPGRVADFWVSKSNNLGESDLIVVYEGADGSRFALLIEDKVDANLQPDQAARYRARAARDVAAGDYADYEVILCAPRFYIENRVDLAGFDRLIALENLADLLRSQGDPRSIYRATFLETAGTKRLNSWTREDHAGTNSFWDAVYDVAVREYPSLEMKKPKVTKGSAWITFKPRIMMGRPNGVHIAFKSGKGFIDLNFNNTAATLLHPAVVHMLEPGMTIHQTSASAVVRLAVEGFDVGAGFEPQECLVRNALAAASTLVEFYRKNGEGLDAAATASSTA